MKVGITTFVHGWYADYIPVFIHSVLAAYPDYFVKVFVQDSLPTHVWDSLSKIESDQFQIVEGFFKDRISDDPSKKSYFHRWLIPYENLHEFDYTFICDVDFIMLKETPSLHEKRVSVSHGLPYANFLRSPHPDYPPRISGWHFIKTKEYYDKVEPVIQRILDDRSFDISNPPSYSYDNGQGSQQWGQEALLHSIIQAAFGISEAIDERHNSYPYHHGLHLGPFRGELPQRLRNNDSQAKLHVGRNLVYWQRSKDVMSVMRSQIFQEIRENVKEDKIKTILNNVQSYFQKMMI